MNIQVAQQYLLSLPLYEKRAAITKKIKNFWPLAFEMSPVEIDSCIQPTDSEIFATALDDFSVTRFEIPTTATLASGNLADYGIPRSVAFTFKFAENEWFEDTVIEKKFWWRRASDAFTGLVSDPVKIHWKPGKDLTHGLLDAACKLAEAVEKAGPGANIEELKESKELTQKVEKTTEGSQSFFAWFGYIGRFISEDESKAAWRLHDEKRAKAKRGELKLGPGAQPEEAFEPAGIMDNEIFPGGEALAMELANEFWPGALSYFSKSYHEYACVLIMIMALTFSSQRTRGQ